MPRPDPQTPGSGAEASAMKGNPATTIHTRGHPRLKVLRAYQNLLLLDGRCHFQFAYIFLGPGTIIFQVPPGNYQGVPHFFISYGQLQCF